MSGFVLLVQRRGPCPPRMNATLARLARHLSPDNITPNPPEIVVDGGLARLVLNPVESIQTTDHALLLGALFEDADWSTRGTQAPDGAFAIARHDADQVELLTDVYGSRTIWYAHRDELFLASTSQRALIALLGDYEPCPETAAWMTASGNLGPERGWDNRLARVTAATRLRLDRRTWTIAVDRGGFTYSPVTLPWKTHLAHMKEGIFAACAAVHLGQARAALALSGGCDSRSLLVGLARAGLPLTCLTWGLRASLTDPRSDASIARRLAKRFGQPHQYLPLDQGDRSVRDCFTLFLRSGEGRIEDYSGYTDGFDAWRHIFEEGISVVLRGDSPGWGVYLEPFNYSWTRCAHHHATLVEDYSEGDLIQTLELARQHLPECFFPTEGETLDHYRDRLYNDYELPTCMSAMNDPKCVYAEVVNPLFARVLVSTVAQLPDEVRHLRRGFERVAVSLVPDVPLATHPADEPLDRYLARPTVRAEILAELSSESARRVFSAAALGTVIAAAERPATTTSGRLRDAVKTRVPKGLVSALGVRPRLHSEAPRLAYRMYIASRMEAIAREDAAAMAN
ncbi:MAG TPA: asparagine synthase-related protein [Thermoleophilia bacterium]|nr:asparagine synthase-related protein [Thermoleophilia bacterium]